MDITKSSFDKRQSVQKNYDLIAEQYSNEFGTYIEDLDVYVAGGGESAVKESLYLSKFAKKVTILSKYVNS